MWDEIIVLVVRKIQNMGGVILLLKMKGYEKLWWV